MRGINASGRKQNLIDLIAKTRPSLIGLQETKKEAISDSFLKSLVGNKIFSWNFLPANGSARGIFVRVDNDFHSLAHSFFFSILSC